MGRQCEAPVAIAATMAAPQRGQPFAESALDRRLRPVERPTSPFSAVLALWSPAGHGGPSRDTRAPGGLVLGLGPGEWSFVVGSVGALCFDQDLRYQG